MTQKQGNILENVRMTFYTMTLKQANTLEKARIWSGHVYRMMKPIMQKNKIKINVFKCIIHVHKAVDQCR